MGYTINSTTEYHIRNIDTLGWELTVCNALNNPKSPCRSVLRRNASYGSHLYDFLEGFMPVSKFTRIMEIGGGYGTLMKDFFAKKETIRATMTDISPLLLAEQKKTLAGFDVRYVLADFLDADAKLLQDQELIIMNENLGDFPTYLDIDRGILSDLPQALDVPMRRVHRLFKTYSLATPLLSPFHFNTGAIEAIEKLCLAQVPFIFVGEHSCEATVPDRYRKLIRISASGNPERIALKGHDEYTICFSNLAKVASFFNYQVLRGPFADFLPFELTDRLRSVMSAPSAISDEGEIIRHFIEDLYLYEYLILIREKTGFDMQACRRCGKCCLADFRSYVTAEDFRRWQREERKDILNLLEGDRAVWSGDHFVSPDDGKSLSVCSFLMMVEGRYGCSIYATRPVTCRRFHPGGSELCPQYGL